LYHSSKINFDILSKYKLESIYLKRKNVSCKITFFSPVKFLANFCTSFQYQIFLKSNLTLPTENETNNLFITACTLNSQQNAFTKKKKIDI